MELIRGFSKKSNKEKLEVIRNYMGAEEDFLSLLKSFHHPDEKVQQLLQEFSENTISNFHLPFSIAPNFLINGKYYMVPMAIEESSVVAAASSSAKFWYEKGGFNTEIREMVKVGQVHFIWKDDKELLQYKFPELKAELIADTSDMTKNMRKRGGGILDIELKDLSQAEPGMMQLFCTFETKDSMGANFINSCLEQFSSTFKDWYSRQPEFSGSGLEIIMSILSNLTPRCKVACWVEANIKDFDHIVPGMSGEKFSRRFYLGVRVAEIDPYRATTHNKGIFNGIDAVALASGNDFRAVEACGHAFASRSGHYAPLSRVELDGKSMKFILELPLSLGTVGGLTTLHPLAGFSLKLLGNPTAKELMSIAAAVGLANNFSAVRSLVTTGIQQGHMKMHLFNIMKQLNVPEAHKKAIINYFSSRKVSVHEVRKVAEEIKYTGKLIQPEII